MSSLQFHFLGRPQFTRDGQFVELSSGKAVGMLAYLATRRTPQPRDHLLGLFWPESAPDAARKNLRNTLWALRKLLGDDAIDTANDLLALASSAQVDVAEFEQAASTPSPAALDLYRGPFLNGVNVTDAPDFEVWLTAERDRLSQLYLRSIATHIHAQRVAGNWQAVVDLANRALAQDNLQEPMHRALMEAYARLGQRAEALHQYDRLVETLSRELGVEPLPETESLRLAIHSGEVGPATLSPIQAPPQFGRQPVVGESSQMPKGVFVGRQPEIEVLNGALQSAKDGHARVALLTGEMGIGKSRLWREWSEAAGDGAVVLATRCIDSNQTLPFQPVTDMLRRRMCFQHLFTPGSPVSPVWLAEIARLLPEIRASLPGLPPPSNLPPDEERHRLFEALAQAVSGVAAGPLVLFIDDVHWADHTTLDWLGYLLNRMHDRPLLVVLAYRPEETGPNLSTLIAEWGRRGVATKITLPRLTEAESSQLVEKWIADPQLRAQVGRRILTQSGGNPYFLIELCQIAPDEMPPELSELIRARLNRLPAPAQQVLQSAAVLEPDFNFATLRRASGRDEHETLDALDVLLGASILAEHADGRGSEYTFTHPLVAAVVRDGLSGARRTFLHRRAAEALVAAHRQHLAPATGRIARHYAEAGDGKRAAAFFDQAAAHALSLAAPAEAIDFAKRALEREPSARRHMTLGQVLSWHGALDEARDAFRSALAAFESARNWQGVASACLGLAATYLPLGQGQDIAHWVKTGLGYLDVKADPVAHAEAQFLLGAAELLNGRDLAAAEKHLTESTRIAVENDLALNAARSTFETGNLLSQRGDYDGAVRCFEESARLGHETRNQFQELIGRNNAAYNLILAGKLDAARTHIDTALQLADAFALHSPRQWLYSTRGELALAERQWDEAEAWFKRGLAEAEAHDNTRQAANYQANLGLAARGRGDLGAALGLLTSADDAANRLDAMPLRIQTALWLAELHLERGERAAAQTVLARVEPVLAGSGRGTLLAWAGRLRASVA